MAKNKKKKKGGYKAPLQSSQDIVDAIVSIAQKIHLTDEPGPLWGELHKAFLKSTVEAPIAAKIIMHKDIEELKKVVSQLKSGSDVLIEEVVEELPELEHETVIDALRVFRKRIKFMKLDHESKLGVGPLTGGRELQFDSVMAPHEYPMEIWKALVRDGHLIDDGGGFFRIPDSKS